MNPSITALHIFLNMLATSLLPNSYSLINLLITASGSSSLRIPLSSSPYISGHFNFADFADELQSSSFFTTFFISSIFSTIFFSSFLILSFLMSSIFLNEEISLFKDFIQSVATSSSAFFFTLITRLKSRMY